MKDFNSIRSSLVTHVRSQKDFTDLYGSNRNLTVNDDGDMVIMDCETAIFRDNLNRGTKMSLRNAIQQIIPAGYDLDDVLKELIEEKPKKGTISIESIVAKYRIINE
jgi:hypothetical protein